MTDTPITAEVDYGEIEIRALAMALPSALESISTLDRAERKARAEISDLKKGIERLKRQRDEAKAKAADVEKRLSATIIDLSSEIARLRTNWYHSKEILKVAQ